MNKDVLYNKIIKQASMIDLDIGSVEEKLKIVEFVDDLCEDIEGMTLEQGVMGTLTFMKEEGISPYELCFFKETLNVFRHM